MVLVTVIYTCIQILGAPLKPIATGVIRRYCSSERVCGLRLELVQLYCYACAFCNLSSTIRGSSLLPAINVHMETACLGVRNGGEPGLFKFSKEEAGTSILCLLCLHS